MTTAAETPEHVEFFFDPMCPWAYRTSLWIREVRRQRPLAVTWRFFSLEEANRAEGGRHPWERPWSYGWSQMRVGALLRREGADAVDRWYAAVGEAFFARGMPTFTVEGARDVVAGLGWPADLVDAALADPTTSDEVLADHTRLVDGHGGHGVPTLVLPGPGDGHALFGPVILDPPEGAAAVRLWDLVAGWREFGDLYELRHPKTETDLHAIGDAFAPYLRARAWNTVEHPAP
jgi:protein-disulfide isomerase-like protein with CxxC motif